MYNERLVKLLKIGVAILLAALIFSLGYGTASIQSRMNKKEAQASQTVKKKEAEPHELKRKGVEDFLIAYYTRKDLGENRKRYKPFMTESLYNATVSDEDTPLQKTYKGYVVDRIYQNATIYIDSENKEVIAQVRYSQTILEEKDNRDGKSYNEQGTATLRLNYSETENKFLVNNIEAVVLSDGSELSVGETAKAVIGKTRGKEKR
ncbi:hypothetical protein BU202_00795 [Streptococcus cuniculi]|uniref:Uncharacterized protein n=1 Tax=Streptococcus cuniculi TaxID=1432788 RepID=A0A1Q8EAN5_9STRE|nr:hypothetical protein [Streptococcus cuniculi]OLF48858.1 hypothetical protein BU202_00795 [Streptococcus cuniculi]